MTSTVERRYRRVLRLLPANYRGLWGEDMVTAYLEQASSGRGRLVERLSVVWLAVRLRLNGSHASPRGLVWYHIAHALALLVLLYQAVAATAMVAFGIGVVALYPGGSLGFLFPASVLSGLPWVPAFACFVAGRVVAARVFAVLAFLAAIGFMLGVVVINGPSRTPLGISDVSRWGWLVLSVLAVFVTPSGARVSRWPWTVAYLVGALIASGLAWPANSLGPLVRAEWTHHFGLADIASLGLVVGMVVALVRVWWTRSPHWLLALAATAGGIAAVRLLLLLARTPLPPGIPPPGTSYAGQMYVLNVTLLSLAFACSVVGLIRWYRIPARTRS